MLIALSVALIAGFLAPSGQADDRGPDVPRGKGDQCVAAVGDMRRNHMDYIMHQRDETVIQGIRGKRFSLVDCVECHAQKDSAGKPVRIDAEGQFCQSCHSFAAVRIDCFTCHRATPDETSVQTGSRSAHPAPASAGFVALRPYHGGEAHTGSPAK